MGPNIRNYLFLPLSVNKSSGLVYPLDPFIRSLTWHFVPTGIGCCVLAPGPLGGRILGPAQQVAVLLEGAGRLGQHRGRELHQGRGISGWDLELSAKEMLKCAGEIFSHLNWLRL